MSRRWKENEEKLHYLFISGEENIREYPPVDPTLLSQSAQEFKKLMKEGSKVLDKLADSKEFDEKLMYAAQESNLKEVKRLIESIGVTADLDIQYDPDGLRLTFISQVQNMNCCKLTMALRWR